MRNDDWAIRNLVDPAMFLVCVCCMYVALFRAANMVSNQSE